jgi:hypothetical protein
MSAVKIAIFGSCVSRDPFAFLPDTRYEIDNYVARTSMADLFGPPVAFQPDWYAHLPSFEQRCIRDDLAKTAVKTLLQQPFDYLLIDCIDERFDLLQVGNALVSNTRHIRQAAFEETYPHTHVAPRLASDTTERWKAGAQKFFEHLMQQGVRQEQIILHEALWATENKTASGECTPFADAVQVQIAANNALIEVYFEEMRRAAPNARSLRVPPCDLFADPEHRWSKEPFHYVPSYYSAMLGALGEMISLNG